MSSPFCCCTVSIQIGNRWDLTSRRVTFQVFHQIKGDTCASISNLDWLNLAPSKILNSRAKILYKILHGLAKILEECTCESARSLLKLRSTTCPYLDFGTFWFRLVRSDVQVFEAETQQTSRCRMWEVFDRGRIMYNCAACTELTIVTCLRNELIHENKHKTSLHVVFGFWCTQYKTNGWEYSSAFK